MTTNVNDVPSPIDFHSMHEAREWESTAMARPYRAEFFEAIAARLEGLPRAAPRILDLGSGPGFVAFHLLARLPAARVHLLDYSQAMLELARARLVGFGNRAEFIARDFKSGNWTQDLGRFDSIVTVQAVHELRHKQHADALHRAVASILEPGGLYLVCDHYCGPGAMTNDQLYMSLDEHQACLARAGFNAEAVLIKGGRVLYACRRVR